MEDIRKKFRKLSTQVSRRYTRSFDKSQTLPVSPKMYVVNCTAVPITGLDRPRGFQDAEAPRFQGNRNVEVVSLSTLYTGRMYPQGNIPGNHFLQRMCRPQSHRIISMKNSSDTTWNRTRNLPACSSVPRPTAPRRAPTKHINSSIKASRR